MSEPRGNQSGTRVDLALGWVPNNRVDAMGPPGSLGHGGHGCWLLLLCAQCASYSTRAYLRGTYLDHTKHVAMPFLPNFHSNQRQPNPQNAKPETKTKGPTIKREESKIKYTYIRYLKYVVGLCCN